MVASVAYRIMTEFNNQAKMLHAQEDIAEAFLWEDAVGMVNNLQHGRSALEWLPEVIAATKHTRDGEYNPDLKYVLDEIIQCLEIRLEALSA